MSFPGVLSSRVRVTSILAGYQRSSEVPQPQASQGFGVVHVSTPFAETGHRFWKKNDPNGFDRVYGEGLPTFVPSEARQFVLTTMPAN